MGWEAHTVGGRHVFGRGERAGGRTGRWVNGEVGGWARGVVRCARGTRVGRRWWVGVAGWRCDGGGSGTYRAAAGGEAGSGGT